MASKAPQSKDRRVRINITLRPRVLAVVQRLAESENRSVSQTIDLILEQAIQDPRERSHE